MATFRDDIALLRRLLAVGPQASAMQIHGPANGPLGLSLAEDPLHAWHLQCEDALRRIEDSDQQRADLAANAQREWAKQRQQVASAASRLSGRDRGRILRALES